MLTPLQISDAFDIVRPCPLRVRWILISTGFLCPSTTQMFMKPALITISIAATQMYRSLIDFVSTNVYGILSFCNSARSQ